MKKIGVGLIVLVAMVISPMKLMAVQIDFRFTYPGVTCLPEAGKVDGMVGQADDVWNSEIAGTAFSDAAVVDISGTTLEGVTLSCDCSRGWYSTTDYSSPYRLFKVAAFSKAVASGGQGLCTMTLSDPDGVLAGKTFDVYLYHAYDVDNTAYGYDRFRGIYSVNGESQAGGSPYDAEFISGDDGNYSLFSDVSVNVDGDIVITWEPENDDAISAALNGFQLVEVPEPATMLLVLAGGALSLIKRKK